MNKALIKSGLLGILLMFSMFVLVGFQDNILYKIVEYPIVISFFSSIIGFPAGITLFYKNNDKAKNKTKR